MVNQKSEGPIRKWFIQPEGDRLNTEQWYGPGDVVPILAHATPAKQLSYSVGEQHTKVIMNERSPGFMKPIIQSMPMSSLLRGQ